MASPVNGFTINATPSAPVPVPVAETRGVATATATLRQKTGSRKFESTVSWGMKQYELTLDIPLDRPYDEMREGERSDLEEVVKRYKEAFMENFKKEAEKHAAMQPGTDFEIVFTEAGYTATTPKKETFEVVTLEAKTLSETIRSGSTEGIKKGLDSIAPPKPSPAPAPAPIAPAPVAPPLPKAAVEMTTQTAIIRPLGKYRTFGKAGTTCVLGVGNIDEQPDIKIPLTSEQLIPSFLTEKLKALAQQDERQQITFSIPDNTPEDTIVALRNAILLYAAKTQHDSGYEKIQLIMSEKQRQLLNKPEIEHPYVLPISKPHPFPDLERAVQEDYIFGNTTYIIGVGEDKQAIAVDSSETVLEALKIPKQPIQLSLKLLPGPSFKDSAHAIHDAILLYAAIHQTDPHCLQTIVLLITQEQRNAMFPPQELPRSIPFWDRVKNVLPKSSH